MASNLQLTLPFPINRRCVFASFVPGANAELLSRLLALTDGSGFRGLWLWGSAGLGKSHLLQASCHAVSLAAQRPVAYLPLAELAADPQLLDGLDAFELVALDDVERWLGQRALEEALIALYQGLLQRGGVLVCASALPPAASRCHFADLQSRLGGLVTYRLLPLDDEGRAEALRAAAEERGLAVDAAVIEFWLARRPRQLDSLLADLAVVDRLALAAGRRLTIPLLKDALAL